MSPLFPAGSDKRGLFCRKRSCPAPERLTSPVVDNHYSSIPDVLSLYGNTDDCISDLLMEVPAGKKESFQPNTIWVVVCVEFKHVCLSPMSVL